MQLHDIMVSEKINYRIIGLSHLCHVFGVLADAASRIGAAPSVFGGMSQVATHTTPHYTTPNQNFTPFSTFTSHTVIVYS